MKNNDGGVLLLVKPIIVHWCFSRFLNSANGTKSRNTSHVRFFHFFLFGLEISALSIRIKELEPLENTIEDLRSKLADEEKIKNSLQSGKLDLS